jgi:hypothetical protein
MTPCFKAWAGIALALLLGGCAQGIGAISQGIQTDAEFNELFLEDVQQANLLAQQTNDILAIKCWSYLEHFAVANAPGEATATGKVAGVLSIYQRGRNLRRQVVEFKISDQFRLECGPMLTDTMGALGRIGIRLVL